MSIHPSSVVSKEAVIGKGVEIGPFCVIKGRVTIGDGTVLESHVVLGNEWGKITLGKNNRVASGAAIGGPPQDLSYKGQPTELQIGDRNVIREFVTMNCGTEKGGGITRVGSDCLIMAYSHVAHDCQLGDHIVIANTSQLAGHVTLEDHVKVGGVCAFNQFVRVGKHSFITGGSEVNKDVLPFTIAQGKYAVMRATNRVGLERAGYPKEDVDGINRAVRIVTKGGGTIDESLARIQEECASTELLTYFINFIKSSSRGIAI